MVFHFYSIVSGIAILAVPSDLCRARERDSHFRTASLCAIQSVENIISVLNGNAIFNMYIIEFWEEVKSELQELLTNN